MEHFSRWNEVLDECLPTWVGEFSYSHLDNVADQSDMMVIIKSCLEKIRSNFPGEFSGETQNLKYWNWWLSKKEITTSSYVTLPNGEIAENPEIHTYFIFELSISFGDMRQHEEFGRWLESFDKRVSWLPKSNARYANARYA